MWTTVTKEDVEKRCEEIVKKALEEAIAHPYRKVGFNYYNRDVSKAYYSFVKEVKVGKVIVGYSYKGCLLEVVPVPYDCEYAVVNKGKMQ